MPTWTWEQFKKANMEESNMAFGDNYSAVHTAPQLEDGEYKARIDSAELKEYSNGNEYCSVKVSIQGKPGYNPNTITLNSAPKLGEMKANGSPVEQADVDRVNRQITTFFECFGITDGDFNFLHWKNKTGTVKVAPQYDKNEADKKSKTFKQIYPQKPKATETKSAPAAVQAVSNAFGGEVLPPAPDATPAGANPTGYPEDIPYNKTPVF